MTTTAKVLPTAEPKTDWKEYTAFVFEKIYENLTDAVMTVVVFALTISYLSIMQSVTGEFTAYIGAIFFSMITIRVIQDFDESYTNDEIAAQISEMSDDVEKIDAIKNMLETVHQQLSDLTHMVNEENMTNEEIDVRLSKTE